MQAAYKSDNTVSNKANMLGGAILIKDLKGIHETIRFSKGSKVILYLNKTAEDYPIHWHTECEIIMPTQNSYKAFINNTAYELKEGDVLIIGPGVLHQLFSPPTGSRIIFQSDFSLLRQLKDIDSIFSIQPVILISENTYSDIHRHIHRLMLDILNEYNNNSRLAEASIYSKLIEIFVMVGRSYTENENGFQNVRNTKQLEYIDKFLSTCDYINQHCTEELTLDNIASYTGFSKYHFSRLFRQFTGASFYDYLCKARIRHAENLLINPSLSITDVWMKSGFSSQASFNRIFKSTKGYTPTQFKNLNVLPS